MNQLIFTPYQGNNYKKSQDNRLCIIGESHYTEDAIYTEPTDFTSKVVADFVKGKDQIAFFRNIGLLFNEQNRNEIWPNIAFANAIQRGMTDAKSQPTEEDIATVIPAFWLILQEVRPTKIIICSNRMWTNWLPDYDPRSTRLHRLEAENRSSNIWKYDYGTGQCLAIGVNHPSKYFSRDQWRPLVMKFLNLEA